MEIILSIVLLVVGFWIVKALMGASIIGAATIHNKVENHLIRATEPTAEDVIRRTQLAIQRTKGQEADEISEEVGERFVKELSEFNGHSATVWVRFTDAGAESQYELNGYLMFRQPEQYGHWGFVAKNNEARVTLLLKAELGHLDCTVYDQNLRKAVKSGNVRGAMVELVTANEKFIVTPSGFDRF